VPTITIESKTLENGFPDDTDLRVEWLWKQVGTKKVKAYKQRNVVWEGKISESFTRNFDPGKYSYKAHKYDPTGMEGFRESGEFLVGMTQDEWMRISHMEPKNQRAVMTSEGLVFHCAFPGCTKRTMNKIAALLHEAKIHYGQDLVGAEDPEKAKDAVDKDFEQHRQHLAPAVPPEIKRRGRPPGSKNKKVN